MFDVPVTPSTQAPLDARWRRGSLCHGSDQTCVDVAFREARIHVRDSKDPDGRPLRFTVEEWRAFLDGVRAGEFEPPAAGRDGRTAHVATGS